MPLYPAGLVWLGLNLAPAPVDITPGTGVVTFTGNAPIVNNGALIQYPGPLPWLGLNLGPSSGVVAPQSGTLTFTGNVPGVAADATLTGVTGTLTFTGNVPTITNAVPNIVPTTGVVTFSGNKSLVTYQSLDQAVWHELPVAWYADVGYASRFIHWNIGIPLQNRDSIATFIYEATTGVVTFTGNVPVIGLNIDRSPVTGEVEFTGGIPAISQPQNITASTGTLSFIGNVPDIDTQALVQPVTGLVSFVGNIPYIDAAPTIEPYFGNIFFTGNAPAVDTQEQITTPNTGTVTFYGNLVSYTGAIRTVDLDRPSGGWLKKKRKNWYEELPTPEEVEAEREALGILPKKAQKIVVETVKKATDTVSEKQAALLAAAYLEETQQRNLVDRLREKASKSKTKWSDEMFTITRALILDELRKKADQDELERLLKLQEHEEVEVNEILEIWMEL